MWSLVVAGHGKAAGVAHGPDMEGQLHAPHAEGASRVAVSTCQRPKTDQDQHKQPAGSPSFSTHIARNRCAPPGALTGHAVLPPPRTKDAPKCSRKLAFGADPGYKTHERCSHDERLSQGSGQ